jgi:hypothetical protein
VPESHVAPHLQLIGQKQGGGGPPQVGGHAGTGGHVHWPFTQISLTLPPLHPPMHTGAPCWPSTQIVVPLDPLEVVPEEPDVPEEPAPDVPLDAPELPLELEAPELEELEESGVTTVPPHATTKTVAAARRTREESMRQWASTPRAEGIHRLFQRLTDTAVCRMTQLSDRRAAYVCDKSPRAVQANVTFVDALLPVGRSRPSSRRLSSCRFQARMTDSRRTPRAPMARVFARAQRAGGSTVEGQAWPARSFFRFSRAVCDEAVGFAHA